jgi:hypothetical protein
MTLESKPIELPEVPCDTSEDSGKGFVDEKIRSIMGNPDLYRQVQKSRAREWRRTARDFEAEPEDFYRAWHYLNLHPLFWCIGGRRTKPMPLHERHLIHDQGINQGLDVTVHKVDPKTGQVELEEPGEDRNTKTEVWYELCCYRWGSQYDDVRVHVWQADGGGDTYEEAIVTAAKQVHERYGNDRRIFDAQMEEDRRVSMRRQDVLMEEDEA